MAEFLLFMVDTQQFGLPVTSVDHVIRMVMITPILSAPAGVAGIINYHGVVLPVFSIRSRFSFPDRSPLLSDVLIISKTMNRNVALIGDQVLGVLDFSEEITQADEVLPGITGVRGVIRTGEGMILITDLDQFLLPDEDRLLTRLISKEGDES